jgi:hypothetical protein
VDSIAIDWITDRILQGLIRGEPVGADGLRVILHGFAATGRDDLRAALEPALGGWLVTSPDESSADETLAPVAAVGPDYLLLLAEAVEVADDPALRDDVMRLVARCRQAWPSHGAVARAAAEIEACLTAGAVLSAPPIVVAAVDELERVIGYVYEPGEGVARTVSTRSRMPGDLRDQVVTASALLRAHTVTDRLPYAMLAEELMTLAVRGWWNDQDGAFAAGPDASDRTGCRDLSGFTVNCAAARVLCHLGALHADDDYRTMAAVGQQADYADRAHRLLSSLGEVYQQFGVDSAPYGLAIEEWLKRT